MLQNKSQKNVGYVSLGLLSFAVALGLQMPQAQANNGKNSSSATPTPTSSATPTLTSSPKIVGTKSFAATGINTYDLSNDPLSALVLFNYLDNGLLSVTLSNTASVGISNPSDVLTSVFWDYSGSTLSNLSLNSATASTVTSNKGSSTAKNVDLLSLNEWKLPNTGNAGTSALPGINQHYGIGTAGLGIFQGGGQQFNYGIINGYSNNANPAVSGGTFVQGSATFLLSGLGSNFNINNIGNIRFQYGTSLDESNIKPVLVTSDNFTLQPSQPKKVPEPTTTPALGLFAMGALRILKKKSVEKG